MTAMWGTFQVVKRQKRLWIDRAEDGEAIYTPPNFVKLHSREPLIELAGHFTRTQSRDINAISEFESKYRPRRKTQ